MPLSPATFNQDLLEAQHEAITNARAMLAQEPDRKERLKLIGTLLRARPVKDPAPSSPSSAERRCHTVLSEAQHTKAGSHATREATTALRVTDEGASPFSRRAAQAGEGARCSGGERADEGASSSPHRLANTPNPQHNFSVDTDDANNEDDFDDLNEDDEYEDDDDENDPAMREIDTLAHQLHHGPDPIAALEKLRAIMNTNFADANPQPPS